MVTKWRTEESLYTEPDHLPNIPSWMRTQGTLIPSLHFSLSWSYRAIGSTTMHKHPSVSSTWNQCSSCAQLSLFSSPCGIITQSQREIEIWTDNKSCFPSHNRHTSSATCDLTLVSLFSSLIDCICIFYFYKSHRKLTKSQTITFTDCYKLPESRGCFQH